MLLASQIVRVFFFFLHRLGFIVVWDDFEVGTTLNRKSADDVCSASVKKLGRAGADKTKET